jgi:CelD/BcsL family acetyltransferase involved in cellulose biosynthesis
MTPVLVAPATLSDIPRVEWDRLFALSPAATPFSRWTVHRAWWDAYASTAHEQYLTCREADTNRLVAIVPLMHRHAIEPEDEATATAIRARRVARGADVPASAKVVYMAASYHADYATILAGPEHVTAVAAGIAGALADPPDSTHGDQPWDVLDLRRLRDGDPWVPALESSFRRWADANGWRVESEREDVCPVVTLPPTTERDTRWDALLAGLGKKERHEIRRKLRRAEAHGPLHFSLVEPTADAIDRFIDMHQARWRENGLFPDNDGGARSRRFLHRLAELELAEGESRQLQLGWLEVGDRTIFAALGFDDGETTYFYNAGMDPDARELSPGVVGAASYIRDRVGAGRRRFDFLRGNEPYKYEWGAVDEPIHRLLVVRTTIP